MRYARIASRRFRLFRYSGFAFAGCPTCGMTWLWPPLHMRDKLLVRIRQTSRAGMRHHVCAVRVPDE